jgi:hypothetical protein
VIAYLGDRDQEAMSRQQVAYLHGEIDRLHAYLSGTRDRLNIDYRAVARTLADEIIKLRALSAKYLTGGEL